MAGEIPGTFGIQLAMSTATVAATAVETPTAAAVESIAAVKAATSVSAVIAAADEAVRVAASVAVAAVAIIATTSVVTVAVVTATTVEAAAIVAAVEPGAGADEDTAYEVIRPVVAVWSAGVRIVAVVTISAGGRWADGAVYGTYSNAHPKLCVGAARSKKQNS